MKAACPLLLASLCSLALAATPSPTITPAPILLPRQSNPLDPPILPSGGGGGGQSESQQQPAQPSDEQKPSDPATPSNSQKDPPTQPSNSADPPQPEQPSGSQPPPSAPTPPPTQDTPSAPPPSYVPTVVKETNSDGVIVEVTRTVIESAKSSATPSESVAPQEPSKGLSTGSIVGMSVAGGVAVIGIVGFFVWKFTRKRFADFDDNEAIKWPELNAHGEQDSYALPVTQTGRAGFASESDVNLSRTASASTGFTGADPYAVPPLPHSNPNQPYRDDPGSGFYDPYSGPVPHTFSDATAPHDESIPMASMRARSPGPGMAYETGRASPAPSMAMGRQSPAPHMAYGDMAQMGRQSPAPHMAYADSPAMNARSMSPGPNTAYGGGYSR